MGVGVGIGTGKGTVAVVVRRDCPSYSQSEV